MTNVAKRRRRGGGAAHRAGVPVPAARTAIDPGRAAAAHAQVEAAYRRVIDACRKHGKHPGMGGVYDPPLMQKYVQMGMRLILSGSDLALMMAAAKERTSFLRKAGGEK